MRAPRLLLAVAAVLLASGCGLEKPSPIVTVVSGGNSVNSEATLYCFEGQSPEAEDCRVDEGSLPEVVRVQPGEQVGVDVEKDLADGEWVVRLTPQGAPPGEDGQPQGGFGPVQDGHYFGFSPQFPEGRPIDLEVQLLQKGEQGAKPRGVWRFVLAPR